LNWITNELLTPSPPDTPVKVTSDEHAVELQKATDAVLLKDPMARTPPSSESDSDGEENPQPA
jgi:hypothetical protein